MNGKRVQFKAVPLPSLALLVISFLRNVSWTLLVNPCICFCSGGMSTSCVIQICSVKLLLTAATNAPICGDFVIAMLFHVLYLSL